MTNYKDALLDVTIDDGKYRFIYFNDAKPPQAFRNGERWPAFEQVMLGSKAISSMLFTIEELEKRNKQLMTEIELLL